MLKTWGIKKSVVIMFIALFILGAMLWAAGSFFAFNKLPIYISTQEPSTHKGFSKSILKSNAITFVCDYYEWPMEAIKRTNKVIGRTDDGGRLYKIGGQDNLDYILYVGSEEMPIPLVYRRSDIAPKDIYNIPVSKVVFNGASAGITDSEDTSLINEILDTIKENSCISLKTTDKFDSYNLTLYSSDFKGIGYRLYVVITPDKKVYLMDFLLDSEDYEVMPAGPVLSDWVLKHING